MPEWFELEVTKAEAGERLDRYITAQVEVLSRSAAQRLISDGEVTVDKSAAARSNCACSGWSSAP